ncbi:MAG: hypothetical protein PVG49_04240 [Desulfobacteraceae bacterium]
MEAPEKKTPVLAPIKKPCLEIQKVYLKGNSLHVVIRNTGDGRVRAADYAKARLYVSPQNGKIPWSWPLLKVDPKRSSFKGEVDFDTGKTVEERTSLRVWLKDVPAGKEWKGTLIPIFSPAKGKEPIRRQGTVPELSIGAGAKKPADAPGIQSAFQRPGMKKPSEKVPARMSISGEKNPIHRLSSSRVPGPGKPDARPAWSRNLRRPGPEEIARSGIDPHLGPGTGRMVYQTGEAESVNSLILLNKRMFLPGERITLTLDLADSEEPLSAEEFNHGAEVRLEYQRFCNRESRYRDLHFEVIQNGSSGRWATFESSIPDDLAEGDSGYFTFRSFSTDRFGIAGAMDDNPLQITSPRAADLFHRGDQVDVRCSLSEGSPQPHKAKVVMLLLDFGGNKDYRYEFSNLPWNDGNMEIQIPLDVPPCYFGRVWIGAQDENGHVLHSQNSEWFRIEYTALIGNGSVVVREPVYGSVHEAGTILRGSLAFRHSGVPEELIKLELSYDPIFKLSPQVYRVQAWGEETFALPIPCNFRELERRYFYVFVYENEYPCRLLAMSEQFQIVASPDGGSCQDISEEGILVTKPARGMTFHPGEQISVSMEMTGREDPPPKVSMYLVENGSDYPYQSGHYNIFWGDTTFPLQCDVLERLPEGGEFRIKVYYHDGQSVITSGYSEAFRIEPSPPGGSPCHAIRARVQEAGTIVPPGSTIHVSVSASNERGSIQNTTRQLRIILRRHVGDREPYVHTLFEGSTAESNFELSLPQDITGDIFNILVTIPGTVVWNESPAFSIRPVRDPQQEGYCDRCVYVTAPERCEAWPRGSTQTISWIYTATDTELPVFDVTLRRSEHGISWIVPNDNIVWDPVTKTCRLECVVPQHLLRQDPNTRYRIWVSIRGEDVSDTSDWSVRVE